MAVASAACWAVPLRLLVVHSHEADPHESGAAGVCLSLRELGAIFVILAIDRIGPEQLLALHFAVGAVFIAVIALVAPPFRHCLRHNFLGMTTTIGSQTGQNGACGKLYPARMRISGLGWAPGVGARRADFGRVSVGHRCGADAHLPGGLSVR